MVGRDILGAAVILAGFGGTVLGMGLSTDMLGVLATGIGVTATMLFGVWLMGTESSNGEEVSGE